MPNFQIIFRRLELRAAHPWKLARTEPNRFAEVVICELIDKEGTVGRGEAAPVLVMANQPQRLRNFFVALNQKLSVTIRLPSR